MTPLREFQDRGNRFPFDRLTGGRLPFAPHDGLPHTLRGSRNTRYDGNLHVTTRLRQAEVVDAPYGISPSSIRHHGLLCSPPEIQLPGDSLPDFRLLKIAEVAFTPALPGPARPRFSGPRSRPVSRSQEPAVRRLSSRRGPGIRQRLDLPPSSVWPCRILPGDETSGNVASRLCRCVLSCGRTAVLRGLRVRLSARLAPGLRPSAGDLNSLCSLCCVGAFSCMGIYRSLRRSRVASVSHPTPIQISLSHPIVNVGTGSTRPLATSADARTQATSSTCSQAGRFHRAASSSRMIRRIAAAPHQNSCGCCSDQSTVARSGTPSCTAAMPSGTPISCEAKSARSKPSKSSATSRASSDEPKRRRHRWGDAQRFPHPTRPDISKTERSCIHEGCNIVRVTRHESGEHWVEFWKDGERIEGDHTPPCEGAH